MMKKDIGKSGFEGLDESGGQWTRRAFTTLGSRTSRLSIQKKVITEAEMNELFCDEDYKFVKRIITFVTATFVIISTCVGFIFTFSAYETVNVNKHQIEFLFDNWQHNYITDIITIRNSTCPVGYESILNTTWQGTVEGCLHIQNNQTTLYREKCVKSNKYQTINFPPIKPQLIKKFMEKLICVKKGKENFLTAIKLN